MLSVLIPTKDYDCCTLVRSLHEQVESLQQPCEIIVAEDGSSAEGLALNESLNRLPHCRIIAQKNNIGRAKIRNLLAKEAKYPYLLFIDSDAIVENNTFLKKYIEALGENRVVCGGLYHADKQPDENCSLRYRYEKKADKRRSAKIRNKQPYNNFATFNFAIEKELFLSILFNEQITRYGHEDTLFGYVLRERGVKIRHIDNALLHSGLESNCVYLRKVEESIETLVEISDEIDDTPLLSMAKRIERMHLTNIIATMWKACNRMLKSNLLSRRPSITILNIYKLGYFCYLNRKQTKGK